MSYILDALRRADAERERGEVPGLQSQQQHASLDDEEAAPARSRWMLVAIVALVVALVAAIGWNFVGGEPPRAAPTVVAVAPAPVAAAPLPSPVIAPAPPVAASPAPAMLPPVAATARPADPQPAVRRSPANTPPTPPAAKTATPTPAAAEKPSTAATRTAPPETRIYARAELPADVQRDLPQVAIGGASYSNDAASRMVIINGQVFHEGDKIAAGLVLEKIKLKAAVLAYKGWRYQVDY